MTFECLKSDLIFYMFFFGGGGAKNIQGNHFSQRKGRDKAHTRRDEAHTHSNPTMQTNTHTHQITSEVKTFKAFKKCFPKLSLTFVSRQKSIEEIRLFKKIYYKQI